MVKYGIISFIIGVIGVFAHGLENLGKGEASASYHPSAANNLAGYVFSILMLIQTPPLTVGKYLYH
jgi:hypothetical protein